MTTPNPCPYAITCLASRLTSDSICQDCQVVQRAPVEAVEGAGERVPVQGDGHHHMHQDDHRRAGAHVPGTISRAEHDRAWQSYRERYGDGQSADRIAERGGFSYRELVTLLGREPETWEPRSWKRDREVTP